MNFRHGFSLPASVLMLCLWLQYGCVPAHTTTDGQPLSATTSASGFRTFTDVFDLIKSNYVAPVKDSVLFKHAIQGVVSGLDPDSSLLKTDDYRIPRAGAGNKPGRHEADLHAFSEILHRIKSDYAKPLEDGVLMQHAIQGMLSGLDSHSSYLDAKEYKYLRSGTSSNIGRLGIEVELDQGAAKVIAPLDDTPAQKARVMAGDMIVRLDNQPIKGMELSKIREIMHGRPGTNITLTITRQGVNSPITKKITRAVLSTAKINSRLLEPGFGYIRIPSFQLRTAKDMKRAVDKLTTKTRGTLHGLILDLRNNPGGVLAGAVAVSDAFLTQGRIVSTAGNSVKSKTSYNAKPGAILHEAPMVILVNGGSASAAEIVAGALQEHKRALIMGSTTYGKGSVQTIFPIANGAAVKLTTAHYFTPSGRSIQGVGIKPDIESAQLEVEMPQHDIKDQQLHEALKTLKRLSVQKTSSRTRH